MQLNGTPINQGSYCTIHSIKGCTDRVAKVYNLRKAENSPEHGHGMPDCLLREISILKKLRHPRIVTLHDVVCEDPKYVVLVLEKCQSSLDDEPPVERSLPVRRQIVAQVLSAISFMHKNGIFHRDIKPGNILLTHDGEVRLCDFNLAIDVGVGITEAKLYQVEASSLPWRAPEVILSDYTYNCLSDIWSVGIVLLGMRLGKDMPSGNCAIGQLFLIYKLLGTPGSPGRWPEVKKYPHWNQEHPRWNGTLGDLLHQGDESENDLLRNMITYLPYRKTADWLLEHPYFL